MNKGWILIIGGVVLLVFLALVATGTGVAVGTSYGSNDGSSAENGRIYKYTGEIKFNSIASDQFENVEMTTSKCGIFQKLSIADSALCSVIPIAGAGVYLFTGQTCGDLAKDEVLLAVQSGNDIIKQKTISDLDGEESFSIDSGCVASQPSLILYNNDGKVQDTFAGGTQ